MSCLWNMPIAEPPTLFDLMQSIVNYNNPNPVSTIKLAESARDFIFDFNYPLSSKVSKSDFEQLFLNKFMMRRIGFETYALWKINLGVKLNEIMPTYNKLFDALEGWELFDGQTTTRTVDEKTKDNGTSETSMDSDSTVKSDRRYSDSPQNQLENLLNGSYATEVNLDVSIDTSKSAGKSSNKSDSERTMTETVKNDAADKMSVVERYLTARANIFEMIFKSLDSLFYQIF